MHLLKNGRNGRRRHSLEAMQSHAKRIHELLNPKPKAPAVHGADRQPSGKGPNESMVNYLRNLGL